MLTVRMQDKLVNVKKLMLLAFTLVLAPTIVKASENKPLIVTSMKPIAAIAEYLVGSDAKIVPLFQGNESIHHAYLKPSQVRLLSEADMIILISRDHFEFSLSKVINADDQRVINISEIPGINFLPYS